MKSDEYTCALCGNVYSKAWSDEEAMEETHTHWPDVDMEQCGIVCDDCWQKVHPETHPVEYVASFLPYSFLPTLPELLDQLESLELKIRESERRVQELWEESRVLRGKPVE